MHKKPFIISLGNEDLPNLSRNEEDRFGFEYRQTNMWHQESDDILKLLDVINEKLDIIIGFISKSGKD